MFSPIIFKQAIIILCLALIPICSKAQRNGQEMEDFSYNVGFGIISTSISALVNKPKGMKAWPCIRRAMWQGAMGGALQFAGKKMTYQITRTGYYTWGWASKMVNSAGTSICTNAAMNRPFGSYWALDYAALHLNIFVDDGHVSFLPQFNILFLYDLYCGLYEGHVDWKASLKTGTFAFKSNSERLGGDGDQRYIMGESWTRSIIFLGEQYRTPETVSHEIVHTYQVDQFRIFNTCFNPLINQIRNNTMKGIFKYVYVEIPYSYPAYGMFYHNDHYYRNPFEFEAELLSSNHAVKR